MKTYKYEIFFMCCFTFFGFSCGVLTESILSGYRKPPPKFHYKDKVLVIDGFYKGESGIIKDMDTFYGKNQYSIEGGKGFINEDYLQLQD